VVEQGLDGSCVVDVSGVGYELFVPMGSLGRLPAPPEAVTLHVHTHVREDAITLYGFATPGDRLAFRTILGVSGVGPKLALAVLSALPADRLAQAIAHQDRAAFKGIPGVGKKTVERILLDLKDKVAALGGYASGVPVAIAQATPSRVTGPLAVVAGALVQMGYKPAEAERAVSAIDTPDGRPVEELLREALGQLA
jgi:Holliday junction DNA helicase RuvA